MDFFGRFLKIPFRVVVTKPASLAAEFLPRFMACRLKWGPAIQAFVFLLQFPHLLQSVYHFCADIGRSAGV